MKYVIVFLSTLIFSSVCFAAPPTDESINKLLELSNVMQAIKSVQQQMDTMLQNTMQEVTKGQPITADEQKILDAYRKKVTDIALKQLDESHLKSIYLPIYREVYTQDEVNQLIAFYESPTGKMFSSKVPIAMQKSMAAMQQQIGPMMQEMQQATKDMQSQLDALHQSSSK